MEREERRFKRLIKKYGEFSVAVDKIPVLQKAVIQHCNDLGLIMRCGKDINVFVEKLNCGVAIAVFKRCDTGIDIGSVSDKAISYSKITPELMPLEDFFRISPEDLDLDTSITLANGKKIELSEESYLKLTEGLNE